MTYDSDEQRTAPILHGGSLDAARRRFPGAPEPFIDLSTGINPRYYPIPSLDDDLFVRLPEARALERLRTIAAKAYGAPSSNNVVAAPGTQILLPLVAGLARAGRAAVLATTYHEHLRALQLAGHTANDVEAAEALRDFDVAVVVNPNNPDGRLVSRNRLIDLAATLRSKVGLLIVDEAFMDAVPAADSLADHVDEGNVIVLRSFGKFYGLAGIRLGFAIGSKSLIDRLGTALGPWAVSGPAIAVGTRALSDTGWAHDTRRYLAADAGRLRSILRDAGIQVVGGTALFQLVQTTEAARLFKHLGNAGIYVRPFSSHTSWLRFGLPAEETHWQRLTAALNSFTAFVA